MKSKSISCRRVLIMLFVTVLFFYALNAHAVPTKQLSYQGRLNNASGQPVPDGTYSIVFSIYNAATGGSPLWTETQNVSVANGGFSVYLGSVTAITLSFNEDYFLGIKVASDTEMTPRLKLSVVGASAYSLEAEKLQGKAASDFALATHTHTGTLTSTQLSELTGGGATMLHTHSGLTASSADAVDGFSASSTPAANTLLALDSGAKFPASVLPAITDAEISATAAIAKSKLAALNISDSDVSSISASKINTSGATNMVTQIIAGTNVTVSPAGGTGVVTINSTPATGFVQLTPSSAQTMQATADVTPLIIKDDTAGTTANLFDVQDSAGTSLVKVNPAGNLLVGSPAFTSAKISVEQAGATGYAGVFKTTSASNINEALHASTIGTGPGLWVNTTGTGNGANFEMNNASNTSSLILGNIVAGSANLLRLQVVGVNKFVVTNTGNTLVGNPAFTTAKISVEETGTTGNAGRFVISNAANSNPAVFGNTIGNGNAVVGYASGSGIAVYGFTDGTGMAGNFQIANVSNSSALLSGNSTGTGNLLQLQKSGADQVVVNNSGNLLVGNPSVTADKISSLQTGTGRAGYFEISNASNTTDAVKGITNGLGSPGLFEITNASNSNPAVYARTVGSGSAVYGWSNGAASSIVASTDASATGVLFLGNHIGPSGNLLQLQSSGVDQFTIGKNGNISISTGANKAVGTGAIAPATNSITIANTAVTAGSLIFLTINNTTGSVAMPLKIGTITAGTSFVVDTGDATNAPAGGINFNYLIVN